MHGNGQFQTAITDSNGNYSFPTVRDGTYEIGVSASGFVSAEFNRDGSLEGVFQRLDVGGLGEIQGRVMQDGFGTLPAGIMVGVGSTVASQAAAVADDGHFAVGGVPPGDYTFRLVKAPGFMIRRVQCSGLEVTADKPLHIGDKQEVEDCEVRVGKQAN